ncbi:MAG: hypothetical protein J6B75_07740 [Ruminococcus sp.]|nr:hypothetical protein [Ruminococcus sp.]
MDFNQRFLSNFINCYNGIDEFYELVGEYTKGNNLIKHLILNKFASDTIEVQKIKDIYEASYITSIEEVPIYSLQHPGIVTEEESIALRNGFCQWIDLKLSEENNMG